MSIEQEGKQHYKARDYFFFPAGLSDFYSELSPLVSSLPPRLMDIGKAFGSNLEAVICTAGMPFVMALHGVHRTQFTLLHVGERIRALPLQGPMELDGNAEEKALQAAQDAFDRRISDPKKFELTAFEAIKELNHLLQRQDIREAATELLRQSTVLTWAAFEVLVNDAFVHLLNERPALTRRLFEDERTKKRIQIKDFRNLLEEHSFDLSGHMGEILGRNLKIDDVQSARDVYDVLFPQDRGQHRLHELLRTEELWVLYQRRSLIVHRRGIVDKPYLANTGDKHELGTQLLVGPGELRKYVFLSRDIGVELITAAADLLGGSADGK